MAKTTIKNRYGTTPNDLLNNNLISFKAKGLYAYIQSKPDDWDFSVEKISFQSKESAEAITTGLRELETFGYLHRVRFQNHFGHWEIEYILQSTPSDKYQCLENPCMENPYTGNDSNNSKKESSKKENSNQEDSFAIFIEILNIQTNKNYKGCSKSKKQFLARVKEGRTINDFKLAAENSVKDPYHKENNFRYLTPEFLTRADKLDKFCQFQPIKQKGTVY